MNPTDSLLLLQQEPDSYNPRIFYISKERYDHRNSLSSHFHPFCVLMYVSEITGNGFYRIEGNSYPIEAGIVILCNPAVYHEKVLQPGCCVTEYHIAYELERLSTQHNKKEANYANTKEQYIHKDKHNSYHTFTQSSHTILHAGVMKDRIEQYFQEAMDEIDTALPGFGLTVKSIAMLLIAISLRLPNCCTSIGYTTSTSLISTPPGKKKMVEYMRHYININYTQKVSLGQLAKDMHVSRVYLARIFSKELGENPSTYMKKLRLQKAKELLANSHCTVKAAAKSAGYDDCSYFSRHFKKHFGLWPSECRS